MELIAFAILVGLAAQAATRTVLVEDIGAPVRRRLEALQGWLKQMTTCKWCLTVWMGFGLTLVWLISPAIVAVIAAISVAWTAWGLQGFYRS